METHRVLKHTIEALATGEAVYTPPVGSAVIHEKLGLWEEFVNKPGTLDPLVAMAVSHYQFEAIHPFADGNGRTGRILNVLSLVGANLLDAPVLYLPKYIIDLWSGASPVV